MNETPCIVIHSYNDTVSKGSKEKTGYLLSVLVDPVHQEIVFLFLFSLSHNLRQKR